MDYHIYVCKDRDFQNMTVKHQCAIDRQGESKHLKDLLVNQKVLTKVIDVYIHGLVYLKM